MLSLLVPEPDAGISEAALDMDLDGGTGPGRAAALASSDSLNWNCF